MGPDEENLMPDGYTLEPLGKKVLIIRDESPEKSDIIIVPEIAKTPALSGTVAAIGSEVTGVKRGDDVIFGQYAGSNIRVDKRTYVCGEEKDIHVIVRERG